MKRDLDLSADDDVHSWLDALNERERSASVAYNVNPVADQFQRAFQTSTFCNRLYSFFNKRWFFDQVLNDFLVRSFLRFRYEVSFEALDKGAIEILDPYGISYIFRRLAERISQLQSRFVMQRVRYDPWPPAWSSGVLRCGSFVLPSLNYLLNIEFARYKISTNWDHKADWDNNRKGGFSRSAIDYRKTFPELQPSLSIQDTNNYLYHNHWHMRQVILIPYDEGLGLRGRNSSHYWVDQLGDKGFSSIKV
ncbi:hypothetical protein RYX36_028842 [Vicia faba]